MTWSLRRRIDAYLKRTGMPPTKFGLKAVGDPRLVSEIRRGRKVRPPMEKRILAYLDRAEPKLAELRARRRRR